MDDSIGFGSLGPRGAGTPDHFGIPVCFFIINNSFENTEFFHNMT